MKEKINLLSKGIFEYENPEITVSEEKIRLKVEAGKIYEGSFTIDSVNHLEIRTKVFSSNKLMKLSRNDYIKENICVPYTFDASQLAAGDRVDGHFSIISNGGELEIPFDVEICQPYCQTSEGAIKDLAQFTNLAKQNWHEAVKLFRSAHFPRVFLVNKMHAHMYEQLVPGRNPNQALEEFLCSIKRKERIDIHVAQDYIEYENLKEVTSGRLVIEKSNWGYQKLFVMTVGDFIQVYKKELTTEDFLGSYYELEYVIDPKYFKYGNNYGKIIIETIYSKIEINVSCVKTYVTQQMVERKTIRESLCEIFDCYTLLQMNQLSKQDWSIRTREAVDCCLNRSKDDIYQLFEIHYLLMNEHEDAAGELLNHLNGRLLYRGSVVNYCYYLYLNAIYRKDPSYTRFAKDKIDGYYNGQYDNWEILWMKLALSENISYTRKYQLIKSQFEKGSNSPLLYQMAMDILSEDPSLLREFDTFEIQLVNWAYKKNYLPKAVAFRFADIVVSGRKFSRLALNILIAFSKSYGLKEVLPGICALLIRGGVVEPAYNEWYRMGIEATLKQQGLYENYMYSLDEHTTDTLPVGVLIYFNYDNQLTMEKRAFLYAYVIRHKDQHPKIYEDYENIMKAFTHEQLGKGFISQNLAVLYKHFITKDKMTSKTAELLPKVLFKHEITVENPWIYSVIVSHRDLEDTVTYHIHDHKAYVDIFMEDYKLIFVDRAENRYVGTINYQIQPMFDSTELIKACQNMALNQPMLLLNRSERALMYQKNDENSISIYKRTLQLGSVSKQFQKNILKNLIDFYYDNYEGETLEKYLLQLDISLLDGEERGRIIEYYIQRGLYDTAYNAILEYGYDNIQDKKLMRLCSKKIKEQMYTEDTFLTEIAFYTFSNGKYDDCILEYLIKYYLGTTKDLCNIWTAAKNFEVDTLELEEKLLCQMLFAESFPVNVFAIFDSYYKMRPNQKLVRAFLAYYAYRYLVRREHVDTGLFKYLEIEYDQMESAQDVCSLALLQYYTEVPPSIKEHEAMIVPLVERYIERGIVLPFFRKFAVLDSLPAEILDKSYVAYYANPNHTVVIYYIVEDEGEHKAVYTEEEMKNVFGGIFVKEFTLFDDERLKYYIKETSEYSHHVSDGVIVDGAMSERIGQGSGKDMINRMIHGVAEGNMELVKDELESYEKKRYLAKKLFSLI